MLYWAMVLLTGQLASTDVQEQLSLSAASSSFSQNLYQKLSAKESTIVYSPFSIHLALTMMLLGAREDTATEMETTLGISSLGDSVHTVYRELIQQLTYVNRIKIHIGNSLYVSSDYQISPKFIEDSTNDYSAKTSSIDFSANGGAETLINDYIAAQTENRIQHFLQPETQSRDTILVLVNTVLFRGAWQNVFSRSVVEDHCSRSSTKKQDFKQASGAVIQVNMMHNTEKNIRFKRDVAHGVDVVVLPFQGKRFCLYIVLPHKLDGITDLEYLLAQPSKVEGLFSGLSLHLVDLAIPKFRTETALTLKTPLQEMGMVKAFSRMEANFTGLSHIAQVHIGQVLHRAVIDLQEMGNMASTTSFVAVVGEGKDQLYKPKTASFIADHPFVYFLRDNVTGQILFQGKFSG
ncbi:serpin B4-like [Biomphalaria glabrata]|uniref:Serpin B4-like n=1 Tax=Biomphalaria glabrata TaxID=6526 RepID=A0A9W2YEY3_BIOGL|nr:serpin B4-like [Biomphalaria glabrata]